MSGDVFKGVDLDTKQVKTSHGRKIAAHAEEVWAWSSPGGHQRARRRGALLLKHSGMAPGLKALEIGSGTDVFTGQLAESGAFLTGVDISSDLLTLAKRNLAGFSNIALALPDGERLPFRGQTFDAAVGSSILNHLPNCALALREICRVAKPKARIAFAEPNMMNLQILVQKNVPVVKKWLGDSPDETAFFRWRVRKLVEPVGFGKIRSSHTISSPGYSATSGVHRGTYGVPG